MACGVHVAYGCQPAGFSLKRSSNLSQIPCADLARKKALTSDDQNYKVLVNWIYVCVNFVSPLLVQVEVLSDLPRRLQLLRHGVC